MPNDKWINFPKNPYDGQIFYYPPTEDIEHLCEALGFYDYAEELKQDRKIDE